MVVFIKHSPFTYTVFYKFKSLNSGFHFQFYIANNTFLNFELSVIMWGLGNIFQGDIISRAWTLCKHFASFFKIVTRIVAFTHSPVVMWQCWIDHVHVCSSLTASQIPPHVHSACLLPTFSYAFSVFSLFYVYKVNIFHVCHNTSLGPSCSLLPLLPTHPPLSYFYFIFTVVYFQFTVQS